MVGTVTAALRHIQAALATLLDTPVLLALCREVDYPWRARLLNPVPTVHLFILHMLHGNSQVKCKAPGRITQLRRSTMQEGGSAASAPLVSPMSGAPALRLQRAPDRFGRRIEQGARNADVPRALREWLSGHVADVLATRRVVTEGVT
jgi:hypothetical protein